MLNEKYNNCRGELAREQADLIAVKLRNTHVLETTRNSLQNTEERVTSPVPVDKPRDHSVKQNDKCRSERTEEETGSLPTRIPPREEGGKKPAEKVEHK